MQEFSAFLLVVFWKVRSAVPAKDVAATRYSAKLCSLGFALKWVQMLHVTTKVQMLPR